MNSVQSNPYKYHFTMLKAEPSLIQLLAWSMKRGLYRNRPNLPMLLLAVGNIAIQIILKIKKKRNGSIDA
ncbi:hypothetical protein DYI25_03740 [Mesobacillus boroniphilus]|uniref:Uncharacterized protein n=1 Tax=Mesobacillus boroniphilus TaxID=308892 RepID=A0A944CKQ8_9BACI|nr:hypothetical protein [Mesobacillus boroniphilus]